jgi:L,D-peptidoglycan transpeptidase YkuD (ErfK/YbiS/YcfS/YnhG family)
MIDLITVAGGFLSWPGGRVRVAIGKGGLAVDKREGDGATPIGTFALRELWHRTDRVGIPASGLQRHEISQSAGWSDDPSDPAYNRPVRLPHQFRHERLWREDGLYDLVVPLGYNDDPPVPGLGSAIFLHCAHPDYGSTEGCVAIARDDLVRLLSECGPATLIVISA